jgi:hypothetical protein
MMESSYKVDRPRQMHEAFSNIKLINRTTTTTTTKFIVVFGTSFVASVYEIVLKIINNNNCSFQG